MTQRYDSIGQGYALNRRTEPTWAAVIDDSLGDAQTVMNVGAGTGNYEPKGRTVLAVEPSAAMVAQRDPSASPCVRALAESLPFASGSFDAAMGVLTAHHWSELGLGLAELRRVAPARQVLAVFDHTVVHQFWLLDYFEIDQARPEESQASPDALAIHLDVVDVLPLLVPHDCQDGFATAYWARPERYLDPQVQASISVLAMLDPATRNEGTERLRADLATGRWHDRYPDCNVDETVGGNRDFGYRLVVAGS